MRGPVADEPLQSLSSCRFDIVDVAEPSYFLKWHHQKDCSNARPQWCGISRCSFETTILDQQGRFWSTLSHTSTTNTLRTMSYPVSSNQSHCSNLLQVTVVHSVVQCLEGQGVQHIFQSQKQFLKFAMDLIDWKKGGSFLLYREI